MYFCTKYWYTSVHLWYIYKCAKLAIEQNLNYHIITSNFHTAEISWYMYTNSITINFLSVYQHNARTLLSAVLHWGAVLLLWLFVDCCVSSVDRDPPRSETVRVSAGPQTPGLLSGPWILWGLRSLREYLTLSCLGLHAPIILLRDLKFCYSLHFGTTCCT